MKVNGKFPHYVCLSLQIPGQGTGNAVTLNLVWVLPLTYCVILGKAPPFSRSQFPFLQIMISKPLVLMIPAAQTERVL